MLDDRLIGQTFQLADNASTGTVTFYGVLYHYRVKGISQAQMTVTVIAVTPLYLEVTASENILEY